MEHNKCKSSYIFMQNKKDLTKFSENLKIILWLYMNTGTNSNIIHQIQTSKVQLFEKHDYIGLRKLICSHKNIYILYKISKNLHLTYKIF